MSKNILLLIIVFLLSGCIPKAKEELEIEEADHIDYDILYCNDAEEYLEIAICETLNKNGIVVNINETDEKAIKNIQENLLRISGIDYLNFIDKRELIKNLNEYFEKYNSLSLDAYNFKNIFVIYPKKNDEVIFIVRDIKKISQLNDISYYVIN